MRFLTLCALALCSLAARAQVQDVPVNKERYPDYVDPQKAYAPEPRLMKFLTARGEDGVAGSRADVMRAVEAQLPEYWNNADTKFFPPVFNQSAGSCGSASRIGYMFTHEINALRNVSGKVSENQYPTHFVWLHTNGNDGKDEFVQFIGVPNVKIYGGQTYSELYGYQEETYRDFAWMSGYDKWMNALTNRMERPTSNPLTVDTKEGRLAAKAWLYNHAGDMDFHAGGLIGLGVASGGNWDNIPKTAANDAAGVTGKYYVYRWGTQVDHAVTMVGWDDRIEFDLDGNGVAGEVEKDEKGAWIIVNSWGGWCNDGFIYCPYKYAGPVSNKETGEMTAGYWSGELYHARKDFRPTRVLKVKMDYTHRSELLLQVGISTDINATEPETVTDLHYFRYAGDGGNGNVEPAPEVPMLGSWKGELHHEPMEFCYDLTDFSSNFDTNKPLKYFFLVNRKKDTSLGTGSVYEASIVDMNRDLDGVESQFSLGGEKFSIGTEGKRLMISAVVLGDGYEPVNNLVLTETGVAWDAPQKSSHQVASYNVYKDGAKVGNTTSLAYAVEGGLEYGVSAVYSDGTESVRTYRVAAVPQNGVAASFEGTGFTIPNVFSKKYKACTLEFYIKPTAFRNWNCAAGPGWGQYMHHFNSDGTFTCGWNTGSGNRLTSSSSLTANTWQLISIVVDGNVMTLYKNGVQVGTITSSNYSGMGGFGDLVFSSSGQGSWQNASYDEIRIWNRARTRAEIMGGSRIKKQEFHGEVMPDGLIAYYKGDTFLGEDGQYYLRDHVGGNHASIQAAANPQVTSTLTLVDPSVSASIKAVVPENVRAGVPVTLTASRNDVINKVWWTIPECGVENKYVTSPTVTFTKPGTFTATVYGSDYKGTVRNSEIQITVGEAPELDASFTMSADVLPCSEHLSVSANNYAEACGYVWSFPGAEVETVRGAKAGATYVQAGDYDVTLTITAADGRTTSSKQTVHVSTVAPKADFLVVKPVILVGQSTVLSSTSRFGVESLEWVLNGQARQTTIREGQKEQWWTPEYPGRYDITLTASNAVGSDAITKQNALIVCNADSKNGLFFSQSSASVTFPLSTVINKAFTMEFWANPTSLPGECWGIGDKNGKLVIQVNPGGSMTVVINGTVVKSNDGFVVEGMWNHYAIRRNSKGWLYFVRNGETFQTVAAGTDKSSISDVTAITLGLPGLSITGGIDEFRLWGEDYSDIQSTVNAPLENPKEYVKSHNLIAYFDFNQSGGDVIDRSGNGNNGVRSGFGPDGDAWALSKGVFSLYLGNKLSDEVVTSVDEHLQDISVPAGRKGVFTLSGQYLGTSTKSLPSGLYIVDGKKIVVE